jgi:N-acyl homoserine lactone hydrolase
MPLDGTLTASAHSKLPDPTRAGFANKLYRLDGGHSLANDESVWTPGENAGKSIQFSSTCWLIQRGKEWLLWDTGVPESALHDPKGWSTLPKSGLKLPTSLMSRYPTRTAITLAI